MLCYIRSCYIILYYMSVMRSACPRRQDRHSVDESLFIRIENNRGQALLMTLLILRVSTGTVSILTTSGRAEYRWYPRPEQVDHDRAGEHQGSAWVDRCLSI